MERVFVNSTHLSSVRYDPSTEILEVEFLRGSIYQYYNVPQSAYEELIRADSKGQFFNAHIRDIYPCERAS